MWPVPFDKYQVEKENTNFLTLKIQTKLHKNIYALYISLVSKLDALCQFETEIKGYVKHVIKR